MVTDLVTQIKDEAKRLVAKNAELQVEVYELEIERDALKAENAKLRDKLSKALDHAHAIGKLGEL